MKKRSTGEKLRCPNCGTAIPDVLVRSRAGSLSSQARLTPSGGRPPKLAPCPGCQKPLSATARRTHRCPGAPPKKRGRPRKVVQPLEI